MTIGRKTFGLLLPVMLVGAGCAVEDGWDREVAEIRDVLQTQADAWNQGSIRRFMDGYAQTDTLRFASGGNVWRGWEQTLGRYQASYADEGLMGRLRFSDTEIWRMSDEYAVVFGRWHLTRSEQYADIGGLFTLIFERGPEGWRIVHDHTSTAETIQPQEQNSDNAQKDNAQE